MVTPAARREAVEHLRSAFLVSDRRACSTLATGRASVRHRSMRPPDEAIRARLRELALHRRRFGYRRLHQHEEPPFNDEHFGNANMEISDRNS